MFLEQPFKQLLDLSQPLKVLDLCAAPGGKSTHIQSLISAESLLVSNEVIKPRSIVLTDTIMRWGSKNVFVTNNFSANTFDMATNGSLVLNKVNGNYWDRYEGYDLNKDNVGDVPYRPVSMYSMIVEQMPTAVLLLIVI